MKNHEHNFYPVGIRYTLDACYGKWLCECGDFKNVELKDDLTEESLKAKLRLDIQENIFGKAKELAAVSPGED